MFTVNSFVRPAANADTEYSVCGNSVLHLAKVVEVFPTNANGNNIKIEVVSHVNPYLIGKKYSVNGDFFEVVGSSKMVAPDNWVWVEAYKGTDEIMVCKDKQYAMNIEDTCPGKVNLGTKGYHVCTNLKHCFKTYDYDFRNRFFKVRALVKETDAQYVNPNNSVLVAKAIQFIEEITDAPETIAAKREMMRNR